MSWRAEIVDVVAAFRDEFEVVPQIWVCPCGCGNAFVYARVEAHKGARPALWITPTVFPTATAGFWGLESLADLESFIAAGRGVAGNRVPDAQWALLDAALRPLVP